MAEKLSTEQQEIYVSIWSKAIETQMHFNEMSVKSRQFGLAFVAAALGLGIVLISRNEDFSIAIPYFGGFNLNMTVIIAFAGAAALYAVKLLDLNVYHKMLRGAVTFNEDFERNYMKEIFSLEKGMTEAISHFSRYEDADCKIDQNSSKYHYTGINKKSALVKIRWFYRFSIGLLIVVGAALFLATAHFGKLGSPVGAAKESRYQRIEEPRSNLAAQPAAIQNPVPGQSKQSVPLASPPQAKEPPSGR